MFPISEMKITFYSSLNFVRPQYSNGDNYYTNGSNSGSNIVVIAP